LARIHLHPRTSVADVADVGFLLTSASCTPRSSIAATIPLHNLYLFFLYPRPSVAEVVDLGILHTAIIDRGYNSPPQSLSLLHLILSLFLFGRILARIHLHPRTSVADVADVGFLLTSAYSFNFL
jgi:hypothetical protein